MMSRSTGRPPMMCESMISSTSSGVTWPYHGLGIDDHGRADLALIEASRFIRSHRALDSALRELHFEEAMEFAFARRAAAAAGMSFGPLIRADEDVSFEFRHRLS